VELLKSRDVLEKVVLANGLQDAQGAWSSFERLITPWQSKEDRIAHAEKRLAKKIQTTVTTKTNVIEVAYSSPDPQLAFGVLKTLGDYYSAKHVAVHRPSGSYELFAQEAQKYRDELKDAEAKLRNFGTQNGGAAAPEEQRTNLAVQVGTSVGLLHLAEQSLAADEERIRSDKEQMKMIPERSVTTRSAAVSDKAIGDMNATLLAATVKRTQLAMKYAPDYPLVKEADQEIAEAKAAIARAEETKYVSEATDRDPTFELLREDIARTQADLAGQRASVIATKRSIESIQKQMGALDQFSISHDDLLREAKAAESNYLLYLSKREQERTADALDATRIANVAIAVPPAIPVLPVFSWSMLVLIALGTSLIGSIGTAYAVDYLDSSFHVPEQVVDTLGIPVVIAVSKKAA